MPERVRIYPVFLENAGCCPRCSFCAQEHSAPAQVVPGEELADWFEQMLPRRGEGEIAFYGGTFTRLPPSRQQQLLELATEMVAAGRAGGIRLSTRPDALDDVALKRLAGYPVTTVELGCQSFDVAVLRGCGRNYPAGSVARGVGGLRRMGVHVGLQLMPGLPGGDAGEALASLDAALALAPDFLRIYPAVVLRGTSLEQAWRRGEFRPWSLAFSVRVGAQMLKRAHAAGVPVIRFGLQASPEMHTGLVAGPYHPAHGQLVRARLWYETLRSFESRPDEVLTVHPSDLSDAVGHRRRNAGGLRRMGRASLRAGEGVPREHFSWRGELFRIDGLSPRKRSIQS